MRNATTVEPRRVGCYEATVPDVLLVVFGGFAVLDWFAVGTHRRSLEYIAKPATLLALIAWAATAPTPPALLLAALACGLAGDVLLMLPSGLFAAGLGAFLAGHVAYIGAFATPWPVRIAVLALVLAAASPVARRVLGAAPARLRAPIAVYIVALGLMAASAIGSGSRVAAAGGTLFLVSDGLLAWGRFVAPAPGERVAVHVTYHLAQLALASALRGG